MLFIRRITNLLKSLDVTSFNTTLVESMSYIFENCYSLEALDLSSFKTDN